MFNEILSNVNWVDILIGFIIVRSVYIGASRGLVIELFKLLGIFFATFITLHYCGKLAALFQGNVGIPLWIVELLAFLILWFAVVLIFTLIREGWLLLLKVEAATAILDKWGGGLLGLIRGLLVCGMTILLLLISGNGYLETSVHQSFSGFYLMDLSPQVYSASYDGLVKKLFPDEKKNTDILKLTKKTQKKK
jgi:uncharacterized membrane protein required for colicin V production